MTPGVSLTDAVALKRLKEHAPCTWAATSDFYRITNKYGFGEFTDSDRIDFANRAIEELKQAEAFITKAMEGS